MIAIEGLTKAYGSDVAVDDVTMVVDAGALTVIVGASGAGKSTLMRMVNGLVEPTSGRVLIDGEDAARLPVHELRRRIGYVIQNHGLFPHRTVAQNIGPADAARLGPPAHRGAGRGTAPSLPA